MSRMEHPEHFDPARQSDRAKRDAELRPHIQRVFDANWQAYGVRKVWRQLRREGFAVARCTVARLMKIMGIQGIVRGKPHKTTIPDKKLPCPLDRVNRQFRVPALNMLWGKPLSAVGPRTMASDFTDVATWKGFAYAAFVINISKIRVLRRPVESAQYLSVKYTGRLTDAGIGPSVGSVGDSHDNALAETINGLFKAEVIHRRGPWRSFEDVEYATPGWVDRFNNRRLPKPIGNIPPAEAEANFCAAPETEAMAA